MPRQNRVTPLGELVATEARGLVYGNRGCLHDRTGRIRTGYNGRRWIACQLQFRGWQRSRLMQPGRFTELFFLDEATALAAGHRPCALCRRADYDRLTRLWRDLHPGQRGADAIDAQLQEERVTSGTHRRQFHQIPLDQLPDGAFVLRDRAPYLVLGTQLLSWTVEGYDRAIPRPRRELARVITPPSLLAILRLGEPSLVALLHPTAREATRRTRSS